MRHFFVSFCLLAVITLVALSSARAEYFVWQDPKTGASLTFPDTWRMINNQKPDDLVTLIGPSNTDRPICRLRARQDGRYTVYPLEFSRDVQHFAYSQDFWSDYVGEYNDVLYDYFKDDANLGQAFASMTVVTFTNATPREKAQRMGQLLAGVYHDTAYILDCSSSRASFAAWQPDFAAIGKSVQLRPVMTANPQGYYPHAFLRRGYTPVRAVTAPEISASQR